MKGDSEEAPSPASIRAADRSHSSRVLP